MNPKNTATYARLIFQGLVVVFGISLIVTGAFWQNIQASLLPKSLQQCTTAAHFLGEQIDMTLTLIIVGTILVVIGFAESVAMLVTSIKKKR